MILRATRKFTSNEAQGVSGDPEANLDQLPKPKFSFASSLSGMGTSKSKNANPEKPTDGSNASKSFNFTFAKQGPGTSCAFGDNFKQEAKMFANKNLFANPMVNASSAAVCPASEKPKQSKVKTADYKPDTKPVTLSKRKNLEQSTN